MNGLLIQDIHKNYGNTRALQGVSFEVKNGEIVALLGPSGCGKSTILMIIAGLINPDYGEILWNGDSLRDLPTHRRGFGLMFQDLALFPHKNVYENLAFGLKMSGLQNHKIDRRVKEVLDLVGLPNYAHRDIHTLSGGESQRVALARSLAPNPKLLMLDEPLGSLDRNLRERLVEDLKAILIESKQTAIYVTHDQEEAFTIANRVVLMNRGKVVQFDKPHKIYNFPGSIFVAKFLGLSNLLPAELGSDGKRYYLSTPIGQIPLFEPIQGKVMVLIRPDAIYLDSDKSHKIAGIVTETSFLGNKSRVIFDVNGHTLSFDLPSSFRLPTKGELIHLSYDPHKAIQVFSDLKLHITTIS